MIICDSCGCSGKDVRQRAYSTSIRDQFTEHDLCDVCDKLILHERRAVLERHLYASPNGRMTSAGEKQYYSEQYSLPERNIWVGLWRTAVVVSGIINLALYGLLVWAKLHH